MSIDSTASLRLRISYSSPLGHPAISSATVYFGYGSNLWRHQMRQRCPTSEYLGIARLKGYKWIIYDRGYANIIELEEGDEETNEHDYKSEVWGLVYSLQEEDEERLDGNEGVPVAYQKEWIECEFWKTSVSDEEASVEAFAGGRGKPDTSKKPEKLDMLVYINRKCTEEGKTKKEYIYRMNMGIRDAVREGMPKEYVEQVMRKFIPEKSEEEVERVARRQALEFEDET